MEAMGIYSLKVALILCLFWTIYQIFLRRETFYRFNRFFLLIGLPAALLLPLINVHYPVVEIASPVIHTIPVTEGVSTDIPMETPGYAWGKFFLFVYVSGICIALGIGLSGLWKLARIIKKHGYQTYPTFYLIDSSPYKTSFSFFRFIFLSASLKNERERTIILNHEEAHIQQKHWVDLLISNLFRILWWFNPIVWLYERSIRENHEFLADHTVLHKHSRTDYFSVLANQWFKCSLFPLTNSFNYSTQLKRIKMMKKNISNPLKKLPVLLLAPALAVFFWAFAEPEYRIVEPQDNVSVQVKTVKTDSLISSKITFSPESKDIQEFILGGPTGEDKDLPLFIVDGVEVDKTKGRTVHLDSIESVSILKDAASIKVYGEKGKNGVVVIETKGGSKKEQKTTKREVKTIVFSKNDSTKFEARLIEARLKNIDPKLTGETTIDLIQLSKGKEEFLYIVDDVVVDRETFNNLDTKQIESISVLKDAAASELYGEKGEKGVVTVKMKK